MIDDRIKASILKVKRRNVKRQYNNDFEILHPNSIFGEADRMDVDDAVMVDIGIICKQSCLNFH